MVAKSQCALPAGEIGNVTINLLSSPGKTAHYRLPHCINFPGSESLLVSDRKVHWQIQPFDQADHSQIAQPPLGLNAGRYAAANFMGVVQRAGQRMQDFE